MEMNKKRVLEALQMQPLSEDEKKARHILGRLYGPIATCNEGTRNGRRYNKPLWEKALNDEIFKEKIKNKSLFLELGHPLNREETDMEKVCACIPEMPKIVDGDLYAYVDILDTNNGRLLKTLCDYGFVPGISSRGSGDVMPNNEVDPETFFLETWDIVQLPAVKDARLQMCEGLDVKSAKLRKALAESLKGCATKEEKDDMKETLENLDIKLEEVSEDDIPWSESENNTLTEDSEPKEEPETEPTDEIARAEFEMFTTTVGELKDTLSDYDDEALIDFKPIKIDGKEYAVETLDFDDSEDGSLAIKIDCRQETGDNIDDEAEEAEADGEEAPEKADEAADEAGDAGDEEVLESLKEAIRQKGLLETENKSLRNEKAVRDAEVKTLNEELEKYRAAFQRTSIAAAKAKTLEAENKGLQEQLISKGSEIEDLKKQHSMNLTESADKTKTQLSRLKEDLLAARTERDEAESKLTEQANAYKKKLAERTSVAAAYKNKCDEAVNRYISFRASMLGVKPNEIVSRLNENYSIDDIDKACDEILQGSVGIDALPYGISKGSKVRINESKTVGQACKEDDWDYDSLLELAGLK